MASKALTDISVRNLKPGAARREVPDPGARGLSVVVFPSGTKSYVVRFRIGGRQRKLTLESGLSLSAARKAAADAKHEVSQGRDPTQTKKVAKQKAVTAAADTLRAVCEEYSKREGKRLRTADERDSILKRLVYPTLGDRPIGDIKRSEVVRLLDKIEDNNGPRMADIVLAIVRKIMNWHAGRSDDFRSPIVRGMARTKPNQRRRKRVLSDDELRALWQVASKGEGAYDYFLQFILLTMTRLREASNMNRQELRAAGNEWVIPAERYKNLPDAEPRPHLIPLSTKARALLAQVPVIGCNGWVFTSNGEVPISGFSKAKREFDTRMIAELRGVAAARGDLAMLAHLDEVDRLLAVTADPEASEKDKEAARKRLKVIWWTPHDLRRTARTLMSGAGIDPDHAERCLGHVIPGIRGTYDLYEFRDEKAAAFEALAAQIERIIDPQPNVVALRR
jgi:integrase